MAKNVGGFVAYFMQDVYIDRMGRAKSEAEAKYPKGATVPRAVLDAALAPLESEMKVEAAAVAATFDSSVALLLESFDKVCCVDCFGSGLAAKSGVGAGCDSVSDQSSCFSDCRRGVFRDSGSSGAATNRLGARSACAGV